MDCFLECTLQRIDVQRWRIGVQRLLTTGCDPGVCKRRFRVRSLRVSSPDQRAKERAPKEIARTTQVHVRALFLPNGDDVRAAGKLLRRVEITKAGVVSSDEDEEDADESVPTPESGTSSCELHYSYRHACTNARARTHARTHPPTHPPTHDMS
jgi:hypothetical protein